MPQTLACLDILDKIVDVVSQALVIIRRNQGGRISNHVRYSAGRCADERLAASHRFYEHHSELLLPVWSREAWGDNQICGGIQGRYICI